MRKFDEITVILRNVNFFYWKLILILHARYYLKIIGHILKKKQTNKCVCIHTVSHSENEDENKK